MKHLLFYDGDCPLCNRAVRFVLGADTQNHFAFAPLHGETAQKELADLHTQHPDLDTLVLLQNYGSENEETLLEAKGALRICWLLGGWYAPLGLLSFLPGLLFDWGYRLIAKNRFKLFSKKLPLPPHDPSRFLS
ncbi:MAG: hypothetical protein K940chlam9_01046 [Chlamydiae bacterium]|nr:hypothetical protein [Chlamydiota bacterium]